MTIIFIIFIILFIIDILFINMLKLSYDDSLFNDDLLIKFTDEIT